MHDGPKAPARAAPEENRDAARSDPSRVKLARLSDAQLIDRVLTHINAERERRLSYEGAWTRDLAFYRGDQYLDFNTESGRLIRVQRAPGAIQLVTNHVRRNVYTVAGHILGAQTRYTPLPSKTSRQDRVKARTAIELLKDFYRREDETAVIRDWLLWTIICGTGVIKTTWNPRRGRIYPEDEVKRALRADPEGQGLLSALSTRGTAILAEGDVELRSVPPHNYFPDSSYDPRFTYCAVEAYKMTLDHARDLYPKFAGKLRPDGERALFTMAPGLRRASPDSAALTGEAEGVTVFHAYWRPADDRQRGYHVICTSDTVLHRGEYLDPWPFDVIRYYEVPGEFWGDSMVVDAAPIQTELNHARSALALWMRSFSAPMWIAPNDSVDAHWTPKNTANGVIFYDPVLGMKPEPVAYPNPPSAVLSYGGLLQADMRTATGVEDVMRARSAFSGESGAHARLAYEAAGATFTPFSLAVQGARRSMAKKVIKLAHTHYEDERVLRVVGRDGAGEARAFRGSDLDPDMDLEVVVDTMGLSKQARQSLAIEAWRVGALVDEQGRPDYRALRRAIEFGDDRDIYRAEHSQEAAAYGQALRLLAGEELQADELEHHDVHIQVKSEELLAARDSDELSEAGAKALRSNIGQHLRMHQAEQQAQMQAMMAAQAQARGAQGAQGAEFGGLKPEYARTPTGESAAPGPQGGAGMEGGM